MKKRYTLIITAPKKIQPTQDEIIAAIREVMHKKVAESGDRRLIEQGEFQIEVGDIFSKRKPS